LQHGGHVRAQCTAPVVSIGEEALHVVHGRLLAMETEWD